jgi:hypothetical protein
VVARLGAPATVVAVVSALVVAAPAFGAVPVTTKITPKSGPAAGGNTVTINGSGFKGATAVDFGEAEASFTVVTGGSIKAIAPAGTGKVNVTVTNPEGTSATSAADEYTYIPPEPVIAGVGPAKATEKGGTSITIKGTGFTGATQVMFGSTPAKSFTVTEPTVIKAVDPAGFGTVDVTVTSPLGTSALTPADQFTYTGVGPEVSGVTPSKGPAGGGTVVTVKGIHFLFASSVQFGGVPAASFTYNSETSITAVAPPEAVGRVDVTVTTPYGTSPFEWCPRSQPCSVKDSFKFVEPTVTEVSPDHGSTAGGTSVTVTGTGFLPGSETEFKFGPFTATSVECVSSTTCTVVSPAHVAGTVDVRAKGGGFETPVTSADEFTYE